MVSMMSSQVEELLSKVLSIQESNEKRLRIVIKNQVALDDKFSEMCIDTSAALGTISDAMMNIGNGALPKEKEEETIEKGINTFI